MRAGARKAYQRPAVERRARVESLTEPSINDRLGSWSTGRLADKSPLREDWQMERIAELFELLGPECVESMRSQIRSRR